MSDQFIKNSNYDNVYLRDLWSAVCYFFADTLFISNVVDGKSETVRVPVLPSFLGSEDFIKDFFINQEKICCGETTSTLLNVIPSGRVILPDGFNIDNSVISSNGVRTKREEEMDEFFVSNKELVYGRNTIIGVNLTFNIEFKLNSNVERMKLWEALVNIFYKERTFYFSSVGIHKIPTSISITDSLRIEGLKQFKFSDFKGLTMTVSFDLTTYYVVKDALDKLKDNNKVNSPTVKINVENK